MMARELIEKLQTIVADHGDDEVFLDTGPDCLFGVGEVDVDTDGVGIIIWKE
jgi:hypothetical protein